MDSPIPPELVVTVDILSPNEIELARLTNMPTEDFEQIKQAVGRCHNMVSFRCLLTMVVKGQSTSMFRLCFFCLVFQGVKQVLVKLGAKGSALFSEGEEPIRQPIISAPKVVDTTGAGDTFTAAFAVALVEGKSRKECLEFAGTHGFAFSILRC